MFQLMKSLNSSLKKSSSASGAELGKRTRTSLNTSSSGEKVSPCNSTPSSRGPSRGPSPLTVMSNMSGGESSAVPSPDSSPVAKRKKMITPPKKMENVAPSVGIKINPEDKQTMSSQDLDKQTNKQISSNENVSDKQGPANQRVLTLTLPARHRTESKCLDVVDMEVDESLDDIEINESMENVIYPLDTGSLATNQASMTTNQASMATNQSMVTTEQMEAYPANMDTIGMMPEMVGNVGGVPVMGMDGGCYVPVPIMPPAGYMPYVAMPMEGYVPMETNMATNPVSMSTNPAAVYCDMPQQPSVTIPTDNPNFTLAIHNPSIAMTTDGSSTSMATQNGEYPQENNNVIKKNESNEDSELSPEKLANLVAKAKQEAQALMKGEQNQAENTNADKELVEISDTKGESSKPGSPIMPEDKVEKESGTGQLSDSSVNEGKTCDKPIVYDEKDIEKPTDAQKAEDVVKEIAGHTENDETVKVNETNEKTNTAEEEKGMDILFNFILFFFFYLKRKYVGNLNGYHRQAVSITECC